MDGRKLKVTLVQHGLTQRLLAERSGIAYERLSKLIRGVARERPEEAEEIAAALQLLLCPFGRPEAQ